MDVIAIGESMVSLTSQPKGPLRHATHFSPRVAGSETNTLIGLSRLGHRTGWISTLSDDELGKMILSTVRGEGVDTSQLLFNESKSTGIFFKEIISDSNVKINYYRESSAATMLKPEDLNESYFTHTKYLFITGITPALSTSCHNTILKAINMAKQNHVKIVFDPNIRHKLLNEKTAREIILKIAAMADIVLPSKNEGAFLFETDDHKLIVNKLLEMGASLVVMKLGPEGAYYASKEENGFVPGFHVDDEVDPVGAGDGFAAGLISGLIDKYPIRESVRRACAVGAMATLVNGDFEGLPNREMLNEFMNQDKKEDVSR